MGCFDAGGIRTRLLAAAVGLWLAATVLTVYVAGHHLVQADVDVERAVQGVDWGPLALTFPVFSFIGDAKAAAVEAVVLIAVLLFNRRAWLLAAGCSLTVVLYLALSHLIVRPRPTAPPVLHVTSQLAASSFPSGHTMVVVTIVVMAMVCLGRRFLPGPWYAVGWATGLLIVVAAAISRVYVGAHWPSDVLAGALIAGAWLCLWISIRPVALGSLEARPPLLRAGLRGRPEVL